MAFPETFPGAKLAKPNKNTTFLEDYFTREIGGLHRTRRKENCIRLTRRMLCKIIAKDTRRQFLKLPTIASYGQVFYEDGKLFLAHKGTNSLDCHAIRDGGRGYENLSSALCQLYSIPLKPTIKDQVSYCTYFLSHAELPQVLFWSVTSAFSAGDVITILLSFAIIITLTLA